MNSDGKIVLPLSGSNLRSTLSLVSILPYRRKTESPEDFNRHLVTLTKGEKLEFHLALNRCLSAVGLHKPAIGHDIMTFDTVLKILSNESLLILGALLVGEAPQKVVGNTKFHMFAQCIADILDERKIPFV